MKVITELKQRDLLDFNIRSILRFKSTYINTAFMCIALFGFLAYMKGFPTSGNDWMAISFGSIVGGIGGTLITIIFSLTQIFFSSNEKNGILGKHEYTITDEGLYEKTRVNEGLYKWEGIEEVRIFGPYILLRISDHLAHIIHKRSFNSEQNYEEFVKTAQHKLENANKNS